MIKIKDYWCITKLMKVIVLLYVYKRQNVKLLNIHLSGLFALKDLIDLHLCLPLVLLGGLLSFGTVGFLWVPYLKPLIKLLRYNLPLLILLKVGLWLLCMGLVEEL
jgi:hypothetical protein